MKRLFTIMTVVLLTATIWAQNPPQKMSYQAVIRNGDGILVTNTQIGMEINIRQGSETGTIVYTETQTPTTNANGLVSIEIGNGAEFSTISWETDSYFIETKTALAEPLTTYTITGISQLLSVPYALYAKKAEGISGTITSSQVSDFQTTVTNNASVILNTEKNSYPSADQTKLAAITGTNTGDDATNSQYSGLVTNAAHTGDVTGSEALTLATVNSDVGTFNNITINAKGLATSGSNVSFLSSETDPTVKAINGIVKSNGTTISAATAGTDYLTPTGSAASLTDFPTLNQNTTGNAATVTTNANLTGDVTSTGNATTITNNAVNNTKLATVETATIKGRVTAATGDVEDLTAVQVRTLLNVENGANDYTHPTGDGNLHVPATGTTNSGKVLTAGATAGSLSWETPTTGGSSLAIGDSYGSGIIFYLDASGQHGLIAATEDLSTGIQWYNGSYTNTTAFASSVGGGDGNTSMIVFNQGAGDYAAKLCYDLSGFDDWYLPSRYELNLMYNNIGQGNLLGLGNVGGFADSIYWSSNEYDAKNAFWLDFNDGYQYGTLKETSLYVRAIRAF